MQGIVFNIQKFSLHDGPGIRTTVFLKGCPLRCQWCANPESQLHDIQILYDYEKCTHCHHCIDTCPQKAIQLNHQKIYIDPKKCSGCLQCVHECPSSALSHEGNYQSVEQVVDVCLQDFLFYEESGGGVTISGGEGMSQPSFVKELVHQLHKHHIHTAIETTGYVSNDVFYELAPLFDFILYDLKHYDAHKHKEGTGVSNKLILKHLAWMQDHHLDFLVRIPVIPDFNNSLEDAQNFSNVLLSLHIHRVQLLPFHQFGEKKYTLLNKEYTYQNKKALYKEDLQDYQNIFIQQGIDCFF